MTIFEDQESPIRVTDASTQSYVHNMNRLSSLSRICLIRVQRVLYRRYNIWLVLLRCGLWIKRDDAHVVE